MSDSFITKPGTQFWCYLLLLALVPTGIVWTFNQSAVFALLATFFIGASQLAFGVFYFRLNGRDRLLFRDGEWRVAVDTTMGIGQISSEVISLRLPIIRLPGFILLSYLDSGKKRKTITLWRDVLGEQKFRLLSRLLSREEFLLNRS